MLNRRILSFAVLVLSCFFLLHKYVFNTRIGPFRQTLRKPSSEIALVAITAPMAMKPKVNLQMQDVKMGHAVENVSDLVAAKVEHKYPDPADFESRTQYLQYTLNCEDRPLVMERVEHGDYWVLRNLIRGTRSTEMGCAESITFTTIADYTFMENLLTVVRRWIGPVSFALYTPGYDLQGTMDAIQYVRNCLLESYLIQQYVSFHLYYPAAHTPVYVPHNEDEALQWPYDCSLPPPYAQVNRAELYRTANQLMYPINVARNIARMAANTYFIFACDIELYPSPGLIDKFLDLAWRNASAVLSDGNPRVFPMPVFELEANSTLPNKKMALLGMLKKRKAIPFHSKLCMHCHLVPQQKEWLQQNETQHLSIFTVGKRQDKFNYWEPFYISDNKEPMFDERVTWEGQKNKRIQGLAMCLMDYEYHVLHPAFLVHQPGIKRKREVLNPVVRSINYVHKMNSLITYKIRPEYNKIYGRNGKCRV